jgi:hypothetical protein
MNQRLVAVKQPRGVYGGVKCRECTPWASCLAWLVGQTLALLTSLVVAFNIQRTEVLQN